MILPTPSRVFLRRGYEYARDGWWVAFDGQLQRVFVADPRAKVHAANAFCDKVAGVR